MLTVLSASNDVFELNTLQGELLLSSEKVVYSTAHESLFVADVHLGKALSFRRQGLPVPTGTTRVNLDRLTGAINRFKPRTVYFLGDLFHSSDAQSETVMQPFLDWLKQYESIGFVLVEGNHDKKAAGLASKLGLHLVQEPFHLDQFSLCHHPQYFDAQLVLAGHVHPVIKLYEKRRSSVRLPCFAYDGRQLLLPAYGEFTGGHHIDRKAFLKTVVVTS